MALYNVSLGIICMISFECGCRGHDHIVVGFTTTYAISAKYSC
jgi:hypothetical protein